MGKPWHPAIVSEFVVLPCVGKKIIRPYIKLTMYHPARLSLAYHFSDCMFCMPIPSDQ